MVKEVKDYKIPSVDLLNETPVYNEYDDLNAEFIEDVFYRIQEFFIQEEIAFSLTAFKDGYNFFKFRYDFGSLDKDKCYNPAVLIKKLIKILIEELNITVTQWEAKELVKEKTCYFICIIQNKYIKTYTLAECLRAQKTFNAGKLCFYADEKLNPIAAPFSDYAITTFSGQENEQVIDLLKSALLSATFFNNSDQLKFVIFDKEERFEDFNGIPHMYFGKTITDYKTALPIFEYFSKIVAERKELLKASGVKNISEYNAICANQISEIVVVVADCFELRKEYSEQSRGLVKLINEIAKEVDCGIRFLLVGKITDPDPFSIDIRANASARISLKIEKYIVAYMCFGNGCASALQKVSDALILKDKEISNIVPCSVTDVEISRVCQYLRGEENKDFYEKEYNDLQERAKNSQIDNEQTRFEILVKESMRIILQRGRITPAAIRIALAVDEEDCISVVRALAERKYVRKIRNEYETNITEEEFEKIFKEPV